MSLFLRLGNGFIRQTVVSPCSPFGRRTAAGSFVVMVLKAEEMMCCYMTSNLEEQHAAFVFPVPFCLFLTASGTIEQK